MEPLKLYTGSNFVSFAEFQIRSRAVIKIFLIVDFSIETCFLVQKNEIESILGNYQLYEIVPGSGNVPSWFQDTNQMQVVSDYIFSNINLEKIQ
jgi:TRAP-type mannitol/chloroaromatic compound transport system permease small subunit